MVHEEAVAVWYRYWGLVLVAPLLAPGIKLPAWLLSLNSLVVSSKPPGPVGTFTVQDSAAPPGV
jgi:hypothetical protein